jgi:hypothetical protein
MGQIKGGQEGRARERTGLSRNDLVLLDRQRSCLLNMCEALLVDPVKDLVPL